MTADIETGSNGSSTLAGDSADPVPQTIVEAEEVLSRNADLISSRVQAQLARTRLLVAGCGSVGGAVVEPLVRLGLGAVVLADPEVFELSNVNRQACFREDVGTSKARVLGNRAVRINPRIDTRVLEDGLTEDNLDFALSGVDVVFDGIDASAAAWEKYLLHAKSCSRGIPVLSGMDFGGKAVVYIFDYRTPGSKPFYGRATAEAHRNGTLAERLSWVRYRDLPADFLPIVDDRIRTGAPWPQVSYCVQAMGAIGSRCILGAVSGERQPHVVSCDTHMLARSPLERVRAYLQVPTRLLRTYLTVKRSNAERSAPPVAPACPPSNLDPVLHRALLAFRLAPSPHNAQSWSVTVTGSRELRVSWSAERALPAVDPAGHYVAYGLGCGLEAIATVADAEMKPGSIEDMADPQYYACDVRVLGLKAESYAQDMALLQQRSTHRGAFRTTPLPAALEPRLCELVQPLGAHVIVDCPDREQLIKLAHDGALQLFQRRDYLDELLSYLRLTPAEAERTPTGFTAQSLALDWGAVQAFALLRASAALREIGGVLGLPRLLATLSTANVAECGGYVLISTPHWTPSGRVDAGRAMMRVWLELTRLKLACQPLGFPISNPEGSRQVARLFGAPSGHHPVALLRVGIAQQPSLHETPRLALEAFCHAPAVR
ncbi:MAG: ThiF family adenylyltransferase [Myxococcota bacterium]